MEFVDQITEQEEEETEHPTPHLREQVLVTDNYQAKLNTDGDALDSSLDEPPVDPPEQTASSLML